MTKLTNRNLWKDRKFAAKHIANFKFLKKGDQISRLEKNRINIYDLHSGKLEYTLIDGSEFQINIQGYHFSPDETSILLLANKEKLFRRSFQADYYWYNFKNLPRKIFDDAPQRVASFSPDEQKIAFVSKNNLYLFICETQEVIQVTNDGSENNLIYGVCDWVYEEEFAISKAYAWSPDSKKIAFLSFDETHVRTHSLTYHNHSLYPSQKEYKYPKVGEENASVKVNLFSLDLQKVSQVYIPEESKYIPRIYWFKENEVLFYQLNREQNHLLIHSFNPLNKTQDIIYEEKSKTYISLKDSIYLIGSSYIFMSEKDGHFHLYRSLFDKKTQPITSGNFDVSKIFGIDSSSQYIYYQAAKRDPMSREVYRIKVDGSADQLILGEKGTNSLLFNPFGVHHIHSHSSISSPPKYQLADQEWKLVRTLESNGILKKSLESENINTPEFLKIKISSDNVLNACIYRPHISEPVPLLIYTYGGPDSQVVLDQWAGERNLYFNYLAQKGIAVVLIDPRGTGSRGEHFRKKTFMELGKHEVSDLISSAQFFGSLPEIDGSRIGIFGWSYGGFLSSLALFKGKVFKCAIAVAPVTHWKWYDTIYTERYMGTEVDNAKGYSENSPLNEVNNMTGNLLLIHGEADDNVHLQHTQELISELIKNEKQFEYQIYPNQNHSIEDPDCRFHLYEKMTNFLYKNLLQSI
jgi:dipeptidyl-peptidase-4